MATRLGICGGTFDPIHLAHLRCVEEASEALELNEIWFMPCAVPPHSKKVKASAAHRLEMVRLAVAQRPGFLASDLEITRGGFSRTADTLAALKEQDPARELYFFIGVDAFFWLHTWYQPRRIFDLANMVVMDRPYNPARNLQEYLRAEVDPAFQPAEDGWVRLPGGCGARQVATTLLDISSTDIKRRVAAGRSIAFLVPPAVEAYIKSMKLYTDSGQDR
ncbi:MAG: nicotinate (nicotinamide) nucleotide adenylyltransferase [Desulfarculus sp.]|nr:MAG: nicotinate (nicotinamide) nucleotide adenylyltransferase [Desulfarculus sp.]